MKNGELDHKVGEVTLAVEASQVTLVGKGGASPQGGVRWEAQGGLLWTTSSGSEETFYLK